jgi:hypothetical protein
VLPAGDRRADERANAGADSTAAQSSDHDVAADGAAVSITQPSAERLRRTSKEAPQHDARDATDQGSLARLVLAVQAAVTSAIATVVGWSFSVRSESESPTIPEYRPTVEPDA